MGAPNWDLERLDRGIVYCVCRCRLICRCRCTHSCNADVDVDVDEDVNVDVDVIIQVHPSYLTTTIAIFRTHAFATIPGVFPHAFQLVIMFHPLRPSNHSVSRHSAHAMVLHQPIHQNSRCVCTNGRCQQGIVAWPGLPSPVLSCPVLFWPGMAWPGLVWPVLAWPGLGWPGLA